MDSSLAPNLLISAVTIPAIAALVNPTVNQCRGAFHWNRGETLAAAYILSYLLVVLVTFANPLDDKLPLYILIAKIFLTGWWSAVYAGQMHDTQTKTDEKLAVARKADKGSAPRG